MADDAHVSIVLKGHLSEPSLRSSLDRVKVRLPEGARTDLVVDCLEMTGYDKEARRLFVEWMTEHRPRLRRVAIVTDRKLWHMIIQAMSFASGQPMIPLPDRAAMERWLERSE